MLLTGCQGIFSVSLYREHDLLMKVGQFPSKKACDFGVLDPVFNRELDRPLRDELGAAVGLRAHGVGIGAYVYLRRIIEVLVEEAHEEVMKQPGWHEEPYWKIPDGGEDQAPPIGAPIYACRECGCLRDPKQRSSRTFRS